MSAGKYMRRRGGASIRKAIDLKVAHSRSKGRSRPSQWRIWSEFKDVAHLVAAAMLLLGNAEAEMGTKTEWSPPLSAYGVVILAPEAVLAVGKSWQGYGLGVVAHGRDDPLLDPETVWRIPDWINVEPLAPPARKLTRSNLKTLQDRRAMPRPGEVTDEGGT
jgi:hypothetical protein